MHWKVLKTYLWKVTQLCLRPPFLLSSYTPSPSSPSLHTHTHTLEIVKKFRFKWTRRSLYNFFYFFRRALESARVCTCHQWPRFRTFKICRAHLRHPHLSVLLFIGLVRMYCTMCVRVCVRLTRRARLTVRVWLLRLWFLRENGRVKEKVKSLAQGRRRGRIDFYWQLSEKNERKLKIGTRS